MNTDPRGREGGVCLLGGSRPAAGGGGLLVILGAGAAGARVPDRDEEAEGRGGEGEVGSLVNLTGSLLNL